MKENDGSVCFKEQTCGEGRIVCLKAADLNSMFIDLEKPFSLLIKTDIKPVRMTAMYMLNDWWTRPAFITSFKEIPAGTQLLMLQTEDTCYCLLPMISYTYKTQLAPGTDTQLQFIMFSGVDTAEDFEAPVYIITEDISPAKAVHKAMKTMAKVNNLPLRDERPMPEMLKYLGWCSWDAFYQKVNAQGLEDKAKELHEKNIPVKWFLIDDGWLDTEDKKLRALEPDQGKFPEGFLPVTERIRNMNSVEYFGVWHAVCGYWEGLTDDNRTGCDEYLYRTKDGNLYPSPVNGEGFYRRWYEYLKKEGISFVKVDGQSTVANFFKDNIPAPQAAEGIAAAIESASELMDRNVINCMGMAMETITARKLTEVSRNSDDFVPSRGPAGFREHLLQNAYNSLYHNDIYTCDWDMFWTAQEDAPEHALLRAAGGGPVYFSDRVGETNADAIKPLIYRDGKLLMLERSLMPADDCVFRDPLKEGILKLHNYGFTGKHITGVMALFNMTEEEQQFSACQKDIPELDPSREYVIYDWHCRKMLKKCTGTMKPGEYGWYIFAPKGKHMAFFGRSDKYAGFTAAEEWQEYDDRDIITLHEAGPLCWYSEYAVKSVEIAGNDVTSSLKEENGLYLLNIEETDGQADIVIRW
ncbi:MAG: alpha-galactosidase [Solobacterium sp.]|nr:alpha-galactosidase [Solobacterium sp.]